MKTLTLLVVPLATVMAVALLVAGAAAMTPDFAIQSEGWTLDAAAMTPDFAIQSEGWTLDAGVWDVRVCAHLIYFAGPLALEDRTDCGLPWAVVAR